MRDNAGIDFTIEDADMDALKNVKPIDNYGEFSFFPVFSGNKERGITMKKHWLRTFRQAAQPHSLQKPLRR